VDYYKYPDCIMTNGRMFGELETSLGETGRGVMEALVWNVGGKPRKSLSWPRYEPCNSLIEI
jgi:hypothetical protein